MHRRLCQKSLTQSWARLCAAPARPKKGATGHLVRYRRLVAQPLSAEQVGAECTSAVNAHHMPSRDWSFARRT